MDTNVIKFRERGINIEVDREALRAYVRQQLTDSPTPRGSVPRLGEFWAEQGGIRAAEICRPGGNYDLILPLGADDKPVIIEDVEWGEYGKKLTGCDDMRDGVANTKALVELGNPLAKRISETVVRGFGDCYWPAICENTALFINVPHLFPKEAFWSSTQASADYAWSQDFGAGYTDWDSKYGKLRAVVVRRVIR